MFCAEDIREFALISVCANKEEYEMRWEIGPILQIKIASIQMERELKNILNILIQGSMGFSQT